MVYAVVITLYLPYTQPTWLPDFRSMPAILNSEKSRCHLCPTNQREHHRFVLAHGHILHQAAPERFIEFETALGSFSSSVINHSNSRLRKPR